MEKQIRRGSLEMTAAMLISGTIGWFVLVSGQSVQDVVFWRCVFGAGTLMVVCASVGFLRPGLLSWTTFAWAVLSGVAIVGNWAFLFAAYSRASIGISTAVYNTQPFMLVFLGALSFIYPIVAILVDWIAFGHRLHWMQWMGVGAILLAAAAMQQGWTLRRRSVQANQP